MSYLSLEHKRTSWCRTKFNFISISYQCNHYSVFCIVVTETIQVLDIFSQSIHFLSCHIYQSQPEIRYCLTVLICIDDCKDIACLLSQNCHVCLFTLIGIFFLIHNTMSLCTEYYLFYSPSLLLNRLSTLEGLCNRRRKKGLIDQYKKVIKSRVEKITPLSYIFIRGQTNFYQALQKHLLQCPVY